jgi:hypothetical protein
MKNMQISRSLPGGHYQIDVKGMLESTAFWEKELFSHPKTYHGVGQNLHMAMGEVFMLAASACNLPFQQNLFE